MRHLRMAMAAGLLPRRVMVLMLVVVGWLSVISAARGGYPPPGGWPWERRPKIHGYDDKPPATLPPENVTRRPTKYTVTITVVPQPAEAPKEKTDLAEVMAYVPENAKVWFNGQATKQGGVLRRYEPPRLQAGKKYIYEVRLVWFEDGQWVHETKEVPISAGSMTCFYLSKPSAIKAAVAELPPEDRKLAEQQRFCAVLTDNPLGAMGKPPKVILKGQPVFVCCEDCAARARKEPDKTLANLKELKAKSDKTPPK
ncbi:MAG TPA: TIGR03000 domain-containing protein [Gemmataceae bacterium]